MESLRGNPISDLTEFLLLANPGSGARAYDQSIAHTELHHPQTHPRSNERCLASYAGWEGPPTRDTTHLTGSVYFGAESETWTPNPWPAVRTLIPSCPLGRS